MTSQTGSQDMIESLRQQLAAVVKDLKEAGTKDPEAMAMVGSLASDLCASLKTASWADAKHSMSDANYNELLSAFDRQGNAFYKDGKMKQAYAVQALAVSLVASRHRGQPRIAQGEELLDGVIEAAIRHYQRGVKASAN